MKNAVHAFQVGDFKCFAVSDGSVDYPASLMLPVQPDQHLDRAAQEGPQDTGTVAVPYTCLYIDTGRQRILVDTGIGSGVAPSAGKLLENLRTLQVEPGDIDIVILTHGHPDHIGGNTDSRGRLVFPNARYVMWKQEWEFWTSEEGLSSIRLPEPFNEMLVSFARANLPPIERRLDLVERSSEIVPGVEPLPAPGHTAGHMALAVSSGSERLLVMADAIIQPIQLEHLDQCLAFDSLPDQVLPTRRRLLSQAASEEALVLAYHFPFPALGRVGHRGDGFIWSPET